MWFLLISTSQSNKNSFYLCDKHLSHRSILLILVQNICFLYGNIDMIMRKWNWKWTTHRPCCCLLRWANRTKKREKTTYCPLDWKWQMNHISIDLKYILQFDKYLWKHEPKPKPNVNTKTSATVLLFICLVGLDVTVECVCVCACLSFICHLSQNRPHKRACFWFAPHNKYPTVILVTVKMVLL